MRRCWGTGMATGIASRLNLQQRQARSAAKWCQRSAPAAEKSKKESPKNCSGMKVLHAVDPRHENLVVKMWSQVNCTSLKLKGKLQRMDIQ